MNGRALAVALLVLAAGCSVDVAIDGGPATTSSPVVDERTATVVYVVDGDTVDVRFPDGTEERVRLLGVDAPEVDGDVNPGEFEGVPDTDAGRACLRKWGERASEYANDRLTGATVTVVVDPAADRRGDYGRLLAYVTESGRSFNYDLLAKGYARLYDTSFSRRDAFAAAERRARANETGLWACAG